MEQEILRVEKNFPQAIVRNGNTAIVTALTTTKGKFSGQGFTLRSEQQMYSSSKTANWQCAHSHLTRFTKKRNRSLTSNKEGVGTSMPRPIQKRIANLRKRIAQINE
jgi:hypothetical protein